MNNFWPFHMGMPFFPEALGMLCVSSRLCNQSLVTSSWGAQPETLWCWGLGVQWGLWCDGLCHRAAKAVGLQVELDPSCQAKQCFSSLREAGTDKGAGADWLPGRVGLALFCPKQETLLCLTLFFSITISNLTSQRAGIGKQVAGTQDCFPASSKLLL